jgi:hypothetical protein
MEGFSVSDRSLPSPENNPVSVTPAPISLTVEIVPSVVRMHYLAESALDKIAALGSSIHLTFFGWCGGAAVAFAIVLTTANITDPKVFGAYIGVFAASVIGAFFFGIQGVADYRRARKTLEEIKSGKR